MLRRVGLAALCLALGACSGEGDRAAAPSPASPSAAASPTAVPSPLPSPPAVLTWADCEGDFECATLRVPLDAAAPEVGSLDLAVTRRRAADASARIGSLVVNPGGPGASAVDYLQAAWSAVPVAVRDRFDLVAFDPRGVGRSAPVRCGTTAELDAYFALDPSPDDPAELQAYEDGNARLAAGCGERAGSTLAHLSTADAAQDMERLRAALGDERLTYLGYSYGTSLGAAYLDRFPERTRAMVLDGGLDPTLTWDQLLAGQSTGFDRALEAFLADCEKERCAFRRQVSGPLPAAYDRLAAEVDRTPLRATAGRTLGPGEFSLGVGAGLYSRDAGWPAVAAALAAAEQGDGRPLLALSDGYLQRGRDGYSNISEANLAVNCLDRPWPRETGPYLQLAERVRAQAPRFGPAIALSGLACSVWPAPPVGEPRPVSGAGAPPVVVIGTTGDPATPYAWSVALADQLESGVLVTYRGEGHTVYRAGAPDCLREPVDRYLLDGTSPGALTC
jgi:pimeloyl-ACP methyl ester carboxylesterase